MLERLGPEASAAVSLLQDDPSLGHYVSAWRVGRGLEEAGALPDEALHRMMVDQLASMLISGGPEDVIEALKGLGPPGEQAALVEALGKIATPEAAQVLQAVAAAHPDAAVSRAARKGQFRREQPPRAQGAVTSPRKRPRRSGRRSGRHSH